MTTTKPSLVLEALEAFALMVEERGPTVRAFQDHLGLSSSSIAYYRYRRMEECGFIERTPGVQGWRLTDKGRAALGERS